MADYTDQQVTAPFGGVVRIDLGVMRLGLDARPYKAVMVIDTNAAGIRQKVYTAGTAWSHKTTMLAGAIVVEAVPVAEGS